MYENVYYNPEAFNLEIVAEIEYSSGSYEFDTRVVWKEKGRRKYWTMRDSGCSCPTPFEDYNATNLEKFSFSAIRDEVNSELNREYGRNITPQEAQEFLEKIRTLR